MLKRAAKTAYLPLSIMRLARQLIQRSHWSLLLISALVASPFLDAYDFKSAYADGGDRQEIPADFEGRSATLLVKISPAILTSDNIQDASVLFRLYDTNTNQTIKFVSLFLFISKDNKMLIPPDLFHSEEGLLKLKIQPSPGKAVIYANRDEFLDAWEADQGGTINLKGPLLLEGGLYHIHIEIFGIDNPLTIFPQEEIPKFDAYLSVGDIYNTQVKSLNNTYNTTIVSYYDYVKDFSFDPARNEFEWTMPFNYNLTRIENEGDIFVHEELRIPWSLPGITNRTSFVGAVDGKELERSSIALDPYSSDSQLYVHFLIDKQRVIDLVRDNPQLDKQGTMKFTLSPATPEDMETSTTMYSDSGNVMTTLSWYPGQLSANTPANLTLHFYDQLSRKPITGDVNYDLLLYPSSGLPGREPVIKMEGNVASNGTDTLNNLVFSENGIYDMEINFKETVGSASSPDPSRNGRSLGVVVVPEFDSASLVAVTAGLVMTSVGFSRLRRTKGL